MNKDLKAQWLKSIVCYDDEHFVEIEDGLLTIVSFETGDCLAIGHGYGFVTGKITKVMVKAKFCGDTAETIRRIIRICRLDNQDAQPLYKASATQALRKELNNG